MIYLCHAINCDTRIPSNRLMCPRHWFLVPAELRKAVWQTYRPQQQEGQAPTQAYLDAARAAIDYVAQVEGLPPIPSDEDVIKTLEAMLAKERK